MDVLSEEQIIQGILNHQQGLFDLASDFYHNQYHRLDEVLSNSRSFQPDLIHAFNREYGDRFKKVKSALAKIDPERIDGIPSLTPEKIKALYSRCVSALTQGNPSKKRKTSTVGAS